MIQRQLSENQSVARKIVSVISLPIGEISMETTIQDVHHLLFTKAAATGIMDWWKRKYPEDMRRFVTSFKHQALYINTPEDVHHILTRSSDALGQIKKEEDIPTTRDAHVHYAMEYLFHDLLERLRASTHLG